jgi:hypothetical protein
LAQAEQVDVVGHSHLVAQHHGAIVKAQLVVVDPPEQAGQRPPLAQLGFCPQVLGRLA